MRHIFEELSPRFTVSDYKQQRDNLAFFYASKEQAVSLITHLRDYHHYTHLVMLTCVDWIEDGRFQLTYLLHNYATHTDIGIKVLIPREDARMDSIHHLWEQGRTYQREMYEMFGISFPGSPGMKEPFVLEGWQGPPVMRRDFDTKKYSDETYSHRPREIHEPEEHMKQKLYPED
ncbi:MAG: NADH-quinone oxidoreductase subunit C [Candidatus Cloacimonadaceae bacterium]|nr:NADH-quinone oxidoreductase subunit C [Candidatus Cloacimonadaceae bacterium]